MLGPENTEAVDSILENTELRVLQYTIHRLGILRPKHFIQFLIGRQIFLNWFRGWVWNWLRGWVWNWLRGWVWNWLRDWVCNWFRN